LSRTAECLWEAVLRERGSYGQLAFEDAQVGRLRDLSATCGGWIVFDELSEETWIPIQDWTTPFAAWKAAGGRAS
jgi:hypothetical protein